jgi:transcriptional regulator GlxA family with amidase domain
MKIRIVVFDGVDEIDFVGPCEVFRRAAKLLPGLDVRLVTLEPQAQVTAANGLRFAPNEVLAGPADLLIVPGGGWAARAAKSIRQEIERGVLPEKIRGAHAQGAVIAGICTGAMAVAAAGLLRGRPAITHRSAIDDLRLLGARVTEARIVDSGDVVTCGGVTASLDLALWLVERFWGAELAARIAGAIEYTRSDRVYVDRRTEIPQGSGS